MKYISFILALLLIQNCQSSWQPDFSEENVREGSIRHLMGWAQPNLPQGVTVEEEPEEIGPSGVSRRCCIISAVASGAVLSAGLFWALWCTFHECGL